MICCISKKIEETQSIENIELDNHKVFNKSYNLKINQTDCFNYDMLYKF